MCQVSHEVHEGMRQTGFKQAGHKPEKQFKKQDDTDHDKCCERSHSTVWQREYLGMGKGGPRGSPSLQVTLSSAKSWEEARVCGALEEEQGVLSMFTDTRESSVAGGKASDTCWMEEMVEGKGTRSHKAFGL